MAEKKYTYIRVFNEFWDFPLIKYLLRRTNGTSYICLYQQLLAASSNDDGYIVYTGVLDTFQAEIASLCNIPVDIVKDGLLLLSDNNLVEVGKDETNNAYIRIMLPPTPWLIEIDQQAASTRRSQKSRSLKSLKSLQCNTDATSMQQYNYITTELYNYITTEYARAEHPYTLTELINYINKQKPKNIKAYVKSVLNNPSATIPHNKFNNFEQRAYDYEQIENDIANQYR